MDFVVVLTKIKKNKIVIFFLFSWTSAWTLGNTNNTILKIIYKHEETARKENLSTFYNSANQNPLTKRILVPFSPM
jgi:protoheme ferro-lyase